MNQQERNDYLKKEWVGDGWRPLIEELDQQLSTLDSEYTIEQIKEKFGGLRYYISSNSDNAKKLYELEREYEEKSFTICEECGSSDSVTTDREKKYWVKTLCAKCALLEENK